MSEPMPAAIQTNSMLLRMPSLLLGVATKVGICVMVPSAGLPTPEMRMAAMRMSYCGGMLNSSLANMGNSHASCATGPSVYTMSYIDQLPNVVPVWLDRLLLAVGEPQD